jgi:hypothetical protein
VNRVGIMLDWSIMESAIQGNKTYEHLPYYVEIGSQLGLEPVFFHPRHVNVQAQTVKGYFWNGKGLTPRVTRLPRVIHNRVLTGDAASRRIIQFLSRTRKVFNGLVVRDKGRVHHILWKNPEIRRYLPHTVPYTRANLLQFLDRYCTVYVKPSIGSVGIGVVRIERQGDRFLSVTSRHRHLLTKRNLIGEIVRWVGKRRFLIQQGVPLALYEGRTFDIRVSVQKNAERQWIVSGMVAKVANQKNKLSNLSRGGSAVPIAQALAPSFSQEEHQRVLDEISQAAIAIAKQYGSHFPSLADLGMDMGVDLQGNPYLIEVNVRDQRYSFYKAGEINMFERTYRHPMEYAKSLM